VTVCPPIRRRGPKAIGWNGKWDTEGAMRGLANWGFGGGAGQLAISIADGNFQQIRGDAAINLATGFPIAKLGRVENAVDAAHDAAKISAGEVGSATTVPYNRTACHGRLWPAPPAVKRTDRRSGQERAVTRVHGGCANPGAG